MQNSEKEALLRSLRQQALAEGADKLGYHQLNAHWSLAFACNQPPEPWEMYRAAAVNSMPSTDFFVNHPKEIQQALRPRAAWEFLRVHAVEKIALAAGMSEAERKAHGHPGDVQYYDTNKKGWVSVDVPQVQWFDSRDVFRESVARTKEEFRARVNARLAMLRQRAKEGPIPKRIEELAAYEKYVAGQFLVNLRKFEAEKKATRAWLAKLDTTQDFGKALFTLLRETENEVRKARGIPAVGEAWVSETELLYRVRELLSGVEVIAHGQPKWLGRQHLDIWIPSHSVAIEYHGVQHFQSVEFFGGEEAFLRGQGRDERKRGLCEKHKIRLIEIAYDQEIDDTKLKTLIFAQS